MDHVSTTAVGASARFLKYIKEGLSGRAAAALLKVSPATGARWARQIMTRAHAEPSIQGRPPGLGKLAAYRGFIVCDGYAPLI